MTLLQIEPRLLRDAFGALLTGLTFVTTFNDETDKLYRRRNAGFSASRFPRG